MSFRDPTSLAKHCAKKLSMVTAVLAVHNGMVIFQRDATNEILGTNSLCCKLKNSTIRVSTYKMVKSQVEKETSDRAFALCFIKAIMLLSMEKNPKAL